MKRTLILSLLIPAISFSQTFERSLRAGNGEKIGFLEFRPPDYSGAKHPLIIFLHGVGEKGNGTSQLKNVSCCGIPAYIRAGNKMKFKWQGKTESFVVLSPQLSKKYGYWQTFYTDELIRYAKANLNIDPDRIFVTGLSLGGGGTWSFASSSQERAELLAGIAPVVAPCMIQNACNISKARLPVMAIHSWDDRQAPPGCTVNAVKSINSCNPDVSPNLIMYSSGGHYVWMNKAFDTAHSYQEPNIYEWFLAQNKKLAPNKKPVARGGSDISITTGDGSVTLDARKSADPDGSIVRYIWSRISGPDQATLSDAHSAQTKVTKLTTKGTYKYQLKVVDNRAEWNLDTVTVLVEKGEATVNISPIALAGSDTIIQLPLNHTKLNGAASKDPDGNIARFVWTKKDGPGNYRFSDAWNARTMVNDLQEGVYTFTLEVSDNRGAVSADDVTVTVKPAPVPPPDSIPESDNGEPQPGEVMTPPGVVSNASILVYPNPSRNHSTLLLNFRETGTVTISVYDMCGRSVRKMTVIKNQQTLQQTLYTSNFVRGVYIIEAMTSVKKHYARIIRQ